MSVRILQGDVRKRLAELPSDSFDCIVTSPPYWGLRDYGVAGQIGLEPTLTEYLDTMVAVCRELRRVLKPSGTFWLNLGDCYAGGGRGGNPAESAFRKQATNVGSLIAATPLGATGLKAKDLCMAPNRLAIRLQEDGWYVRSEIIWHKPNPMPESVTDRPTSSHEKIWLLTKSERYWYDAEAVREGASEASLARITQPNFANQTGGEKDYRNGINPSRSMRKTLENFAENPGRNLRNVWTIASQPYSEAHFATFPPELAERCIKAGCPAGGHVLDPFGGAGTTGLVADRLGRDATLIELNPAYVTLIKNRLADDAGMFAQVAAE
jgi:DNA modification methylase